MMNKDSAKYIKDTNNKARAFLDEANYYIRKAVKSNKNTVYISCSGQTDADISTVKTILQSQGYSISDYTSGSEKYIKVGL